eukprot:m.183118 g.183118  ORF g.183118 m.183118 type:complete len:408 (+) comp15722_c0_seq1:149-1372(+)
MRVVQRDEADLPHNLLTEMPCASVLVRILVPPMRGGRPLSTDTVAVAEWEPSGLVRPKPDYTNRGYDTGRCEPRQHELLLFKTLVDRRPRRIVDAVRLIESGSGVNAAELVSARFALEGWLKAQLQSHIDSGSSVPRIDRAHIVKYAPEYGLAVSIDSARNLPNDGMLSYPTLLVLSPGPEPGDDPVVDHGHGCRMAWSAQGNTVQNPVWEDGLQPFTDVPLSDSSVVVVVLWKTKSGGSPSMMGWGVLPLAVHSSFVNFGAFRVPLYKGPMTEALAAALVSSRGRKRQSSVRGIEPAITVMDHIDNVVAARKIKPLPWASVVIRVCDSRRHHEMTTACPPIDDSFMPRDKSGALPKKYGQQRSRSKRVTAVLGKREVAAHDRWARIIMTIASESVFKLSTRDGIRE